MDGGAQDLAQRTSVIRFGWNRDIGLHSAEVKAPLLVIVGIWVAVYRLVRLSWMGVHPIQGLLVGAGDGADSAAWLQENGEEDE
jgi:hypothetical protein